jgi:aspartate aminotransferase-like enzyme
MTPKAPVSDPGLRISGPTPLPPEVRQASSRQMVSHRSVGFREILGEVCDRLRPVFGSNRRVLPFTASGTGGLEAAVVNAISPGDRVLALGAGHFNERFAAVAAAHGGLVDSRQVPWGRAVEPEMARAAVDGGRFDAVLLTHNETSTGVINPVGEICREIRERSDAVILVDAVSSAGATPVLTDEWGADIVVGVTQKALMAPPGLALLAVGPGAVEAARRVGTPRFYLDLPRMASAVDEGTTTYTPAVSVVFALHESLELLEEEGLDRSFRRHKQLSALCCARCEELGLRPIARPGERSPTVTAVKVPPGLDASEIRDRLAADHGIQVANGRGPWKDTVLRIGHMGHVDEAAVEMTVDCMAAVLGRSVA